MDQSGETPFGVKFSLLADHFAPPTADPAKLTNGSSDSMPA
jgi:hypothetical protein